VKPHHMSIVEQFEHAVRECPDGDAVATAAATISYRELGEATQELAKELDTRLAPGEFVGIEARREPGAIVAMIAAMRAGRPFVFVDSRDSARSNAEKVGLVGVRLLARSRVDGGVDLTDVPADWRADHVPGDRTPHGLSDVCYAIQTSGSTGEPKCVLVRTAALAAVISDHVTRLSVGPRSRTLQFARLTFDGCVTEILWTLTAGACLVMVDEPHLAPGAQLRDTLERHGVTHVKTTPFALTATDPTGAMRLAHVVNGGGTCRPAVVAKWSAAAAFHNAYGTTETTVCNLLSDALEPEDCHDGVPLGDLVGDCDYHLREVDDAPSGAARRGEIVITGHSVGAGYLTERGVTPFEPDGEYRTGDVAEYRDGRLYFVERLDRQVKVRGYRLDPGEVENAVCRLDSVVEAVVTVESHDGSRTAEQDALVCYYQGDADPRTVRRHLQDGLDPYKIPSVLRRVDALPYTPNGKVDRDALQASRRARANGAASVEARVLDVVRDLTGVEDAAPEDNFFDLGGDSSSALVLVRKMRELGWVDAGVRDVLRADDLRTLANQLRERGA
jgi:amino acid adenylation domain-containing protein